ncbi:Uncharacterised protein [Providencia rustigianii]|uniref:Uncharacterized protein n=1 Tax=Providencia rustigianii TaxID=158850 RepID=A0A379G318_9GAMM|nr:RhoGAP domain-containing protein [Providencia rustigianii]SUC35325.1 Uncharacterised protein [Providencia rustigianii]
MKLSTIQPTLPILPIESVMRSENKGFLASVQKIINSCKSFLGCPAHHKFDTVTTTNHSVKNMSLKPLQDSQPTSKYLNTEQLSSMAQRIEQQNNAGKIEKKNTQAINDYKGMAYSEKLQYQQLNEIGTAILSHPEFANEVGPFRTSGTPIRAQLILDHLASNNSFNIDFITKNNIGIKELTSAYKKLVITLLPKSSSETVTLSARFHQLDNGIPPMKNQPLSLQIAIPLLVEIAKNNNINQMGAKNLAIAFAPSLDRTDFSQVKINNAADMKALTEAPINYVTTLIERELGSQ